MRRGRSMGTGSPFDRCTPFPGDPECPKPRSGCPMRPPREPQAEKIRRTTSEHTESPSTEAAPPDIDRNQRKDAHARKADARELRLRQFVAHLRQRLQCKGARLGTGLSAKRTRAGAACDSSEE